MTIVIPGELADLNAYINAERSNRYAGAKIKHEMTNYITAIAKRSGCAKMDVTVWIEFRWYCKDKRKDKDNVSSMGRKVIQDGLVQAGILKNDGWNDIAGFTDKFYIDKKNPRVEVTISAFRDDG